MKEFLQRLFGKGEFETPKFFKKMRLIALIPGLGGIIRSFAGKKNEELVNQAVETTTSSLDTLIEMVKTILSSDQPIITAILITLGLTGYFTSTLAKKGVTPKKD